jgi:hypothetical protein
MDKLARTLLASSKCDGKDLMPAIDLLLAGKVQILVQLLAFAIKSNYSDFGAAPADTDPQPGA